MKAPSPYLIAKVLMQYAAANPGEFDILFDMLQIFLHPTLIDFSFVARFVDKTVAHVLTADQKNKVLTRFLDVLSIETADPDFVQRFM